MYCCLETWYSARWSGVLTEPAWLVDFSLTVPGVGGSLTMIDIALFHFIINICFWYVFSFTYYSIETAYLPIWSNSLIITRLLKKLSKYLFAKGKNQITFTTGTSNPPFKSLFYRFQLQILFHRGRLFKFTNLFIHTLIHIWKILHQGIVQVINDWVNFVCSVCIFHSSIIGKMKILLCVLKMSQIKWVLNTSVSNSFFPSQ